jgi:hypothetical protein
MNIADILPAIAGAMLVVKQLAEAGHDVKPIASKVYDIAVKGVKVTQAEVDLLEALTDEWSAKIQAPLEPEAP